MNVEIILDDPAGNSYVQVNFTSCIVPLFCFQVSKKTTPGREVRLEFFIVP